MQYANQKSDVCQVACLSLLCCLYITNVVKNLRVWVTFLTLLNHLVFNACQYVSFLASTMRLFLCTAIHKTNEFVKNQDVS